MKIENSDLKAPTGGSDEELMKWIKTRMGKRPMSSIDTTFMTSYNPDEGFGVSIEGLHGIKKVKGPLKVIYSLTPPGAYYQDPKLTADAGFTKHYDWDHSQKSQKFADDVHKWKGQPFHPKLLLIVDVKGTVIFPVVCKFCYGF